jgi:LysR family glycine cleavage system transcriptional activator
VRCNRLSTSIQAAIEGVGFAIARTSVVQPDLDAQLLVAPFQLRVDAGDEGYFIVVPPDCAKMRKVDAFRSWALVTLARSASRSGSMRT